MSLPRTFLAVATGALLAAGAVPLRAQGFFTALQGGYFDMSSARRSVKAVADSSGFKTFGIEVGYGFRRGLYTAAGYSYFPEKKGERVFLLSPTTTPFKLGFPLTLRRNLVYLDLGWRFLPSKRVIPYVGVGGELVTLKEQSDVAGEILSQDETKAGLHGLFGVEFKATGRLRIGVEGMYSIVPNAIGVGGVSKVYGEDDMGGYTVLGKLIFGFPRKTAPATTPRS